MNDPERWPVSRLTLLDHASTAVLASASVRERVAALAPFRRLATASEMGTVRGTVIAAGGGTLLDEAKYLRATEWPQVRLVAMPSMWGSGSEQSPVVVLNRGGSKEIHVDRKFVPDAVVYCPEILTSIPYGRARHACGDTWAHAVEGFFSPLALPGIRRELAMLIDEMQSLPLGVHDRWLEVSGRACSLQTSASVGLIHGIAHTIEIPMSTARGISWGHSRICSGLLLPVLRLNFEAPARFERLCGEFGVDAKRLFRVAMELFNQADYSTMLPHIREFWPKILRDACTRTNGMLVKAGHLDYLENLA